METLARTLNYDNKYATELHLQSRGSDKDWGEQSLMLPRPSFAPDLSKTEADHVFFVESPLIKAILFLSILGKIQSLKNSN